MRRDWVLSAAYIGFLAAFYSDIWTGLEWTVERRMILMEAFMLSCGVLIRIHEGKSFFSFLESTALVALLLYQQEPSLSAFYSIKLIVSFVWFVISLQYDEDLRDAYILYYFFPLGKFPTSSHATIVSDPLDCSSPWHTRDWVIYSDHNLSVLKFLWTTTLLFFRSEGLLLLLFYAHGTFILYGTPNSSRSIELLVDMGLATVLAVDAFFGADFANEQDQEQQTVRETLNEAGWFAFFMLANLVSIIWLLPWLRAISHSVAGPQFLLFISTCLLLLAVMKLVLPPLVLTMSDKAVFNGWIEHRRDIARHALGTKRSLDASPLSSLHRKSKRTRLS